MHAQYLLIRAKKEPYGAEAHLVEQYPSVPVVVELCHCGALCQGNAEELVDRASVRIVVACQLVGRARTEDCATLLDGLAGVALSATTVLLALIIILVSCTM